MILPHIEEPAASDESMTTERRLQMSIAVSLKRIADALQAYDSPNTIADTLFGIMMNGRQ